MGDVVKLRSEIDTSKELNLGWICGCGGQEWNLFIDGKCVCTTCGYYSSKIKVVEGDPDGR